VGLAFKNTIQQQQQHGSENNSKCNNRSKYVFKQISNKKRSGGKKILNGRTREDKEENGATQQYNAAKNHLKGLLGRLHRSCDFFYSYIKYFLCLTLLPYSSFI
jgi:hypothetical protein